MPLFRIWRLALWGICLGADDRAAQWVKAAYENLGYPARITKDSGGLYSYEVVGKLIEAAKRTGADYAVDVYLYYGSDVEATLRGGYDLRYGLIGAGVYAQPQLRAQPYRRRIQALEGA